MPTLSLYIDSSVWNCAFDDHVPELQAQTQAFIDRARREQVSTYISDVTLQELGNAPAERARRVFELLNLVQPVRLELTEESAALAEAYIKHGILTRGHMVDAQHVAVATVAEIDVLVSWNYRHLVNRRRREAFNGVNAIAGYRRIEILSPPEVFND